MALLPTRVRLARMTGVHAGRGVVLGRGVRLDVGDGAELVLGDGCRLGEHTRIVVHGSRVQVGAGAQIGPRCTIVAHAGVSIGIGARLEEGTVIVDFDHVFDDVELPIRVQPLQSAPVAIGEFARLGLGVSVLRGITIGARATVGPHAVVTRDVAAGASVGGVPARPVA